MQLSHVLTRRAITVIGVAMSAFHLYVAFFGPPDAYTLRSTHLGFSLVLAFLLTPGFRAGTGRAPGPVDLLVIGLSIAATAYPIVQLEYIFNRMYYIDPLRLEDYLFGIATVVLVLEGARRATGWALPATAFAFIAYALASGRTDLPTLLDQLYLTTEGIYGIPLSVSATYIFLFILFGALVERSGAGKLFMDFALSLAGWAVGGPAKVATITSCLFGTVSGSAVANVMTTGTFTIPLMKRLGYRPAFSGAVESVASTGGQIMPPIMGAAAFVMAEFLGISYLQVTIYAIIPALLYYVAVFFAIHFEAKRLGMRGLPREEIPHLGEVLVERGHLFLPLLVIIAVLMSGYSAAFSALAGIVSVIPTMLLRRTTRGMIKLPMVIEALEAGARGTVPVALACACAGIVIGVITLTGLGLQFTGIVLAVAQNNIVLALVLTMIAGIILGMGMPTTPAYIVQVALLVPALVKLGIAVEAAHLFVLYFAVLSAITPPVALAVYAANGISGAGLWDTGVAAIKLGATGYIVPFMFVFGPALLLMGEPGAVAVAVTTATIGVICLAAGLHGYMLAPLRSWQRLCLVAAAFTLVKPGLVTDLAGAALLIAALVPQFAGRAAPAPQPRV